MKVIEILQKFPGFWSRLGRGFEIGLKLENWGKNIDSSSQGDVGFHNIIKANWKSLLGFPTLFLPYRTPLNTTFSKFHLKFLSTLI